MKHTRQTPPGTAEAAPGIQTEPAPSDCLILEIGGDIGALAIYAPASHAGREIEISPAGDPADRTHNIVRARQAGQATRHAAVFPAVPAGTYTVWANATDPAGTVTVHGGHVAQFPLAAEAGPHLM